MRVSGPGAGIGSSTCDTIFAAPGGSLHYYASFPEGGLSLTTVAHLRDLPVDSLCRIALSGRSNAGKSSAINTLAGRTRLAFVSDKTLGRTQHLNYFSLGDGGLDRSSRLWLRQGPGGAYEPNGKA